VTKALRISIQPCALPENGHYDVVMANNCTNHSLVMLFRLYRKTRPRFRKKSMS